MHKTLYNISIGGGASAPLPCPCLRVHPMDPYDLDGDDFQNVIISALSTDTYMYNEKS